MATTVWLALTLWLVMMIGELGIVTQSVSSLPVEASAILPGLLSKRMCRKLPCVVPSTAR